MQEKDLKTSPKQRIIIGIIAFLLLGSTIAIYALMVLSGETQKAKSAEVDAELAQAETKLNAKQNEINEAAKQLSSKYFETFNNARRDTVRSYNANTVNTSGIQTKDIIEGTGQQIVNNDSKYYAYYVGWCADESVFDSSFDNISNPTALNAPLYYSGDGGLIAGWLEGIIGMKVGGIREIDIPGELAYGQTREICGGLNSPLKFLVYPVDVDESFDKLEQEYNQLSSEYQNLYYQKLLQNQSN
jgi:FKBP-type peptidyl-prolyl cis-trans isomerase